MLGKRGKRTLKGVRKAFVTCFVYNNFRNLNKKSMALFGHKRSDPIDLLAGIIFRPLTYDLTNGTNLYLKNYPADNLYH